MFKGQIYETIYRSTCPSMQYCKDKSTRQWLSLPTLPSTTMLAIVNYQQDNHR